MHKHTQSLRAHLLAVTFVTSAMLFVVVHTDESRASGTTALLAAPRATATSSVSSKAPVRSTRLLKLRLLRLGGQTASRATRRSLRPVTVIEGRTTSRPQGLYCGDKLITQAETCDDGNSVGNDGCSAACKIEAGFTCYALPSLCISRCGDGVLATIEKCDDGNTTSYDGCSAACRIEIGFTCAGSPSECDLIAVCGNTYREGDEQCDDGNATDLDGCSSTCQNE